jgi:Flp pilus assembly protein TadG
MEIKSSKTESGQGLLEFAFGMVLLLILLVGTVDVGRAMFTYMSLRDAAQEGALYGSINPTDEAGIEERVRKNSNMLQGLFADSSADMTIQVTLTGAACSGNGLKVYVAYNNFPITMPFLGSFLGRQTIGISTAVVDTILSPGCP